MARRMSSRGWTTTSNSIGSDRPRPWPGGRASWATSWSPRRRSVNPGAEEDPRPGRDAHDPERRRSAPRGIVWGGGGRVDGDRRQFRLDQSQHHEHTTRVPWEFQHRSRLGAVTVHQSMVTSKQTCVEPRGYFSDASVDHTEARNDILGCFGRSHRRAQRHRWLRRSIRPKRPGCGDPMETGADDAIAA